MNLKFVNKGKIDELTLSKDKIWSSCIAVPAKDYTKVLLHFDDKSNIAKDECRNTWNASESLSISSTNAKFGNACQFSNDTDTLILNNGLDLGGKDFTIDFWVYYSSNSSKWASIFVIRRASGEWSPYVIQMQRRDTNNNLFQLNIMSIQVNDLSISFDTLHHIAIVYIHNSSSYKLFKNGILLNSGTVQILRTHFNTIEFGTNWSFRGSIDEFRISDGIARWTDNFTPPFSPYSYSDKLLPYYYSHYLPLSQSIEDNVAVCLPFNDSFNVAYDLCSNIWNVTGSPTIEKFQNRTCIHLLSGQSIIINTPINCTNSTFTAEFWLYFTNTSINTPLGSDRSLRTDVVSIETDNGHIYSGYAGHYVIANKAKNLLNSWHHVALTVSNRSAHKLFVDGILVASGNESRNYSVKYLPLAINKLNSREIYISNLIIYNGIAKYTENFTPSN